MALSSMTGIGSYVAFMLIQQLVHGALIIKEYPDFLAFERANWTEAERYCRLSGGRLTHVKEGLELMGKIQGDWNLIWIDDLPEKQPTNESMADCYRNQLRKIKDRPVWVRESSRESKQVVADAVMCRFNGMSQIFQFVRILIC